MALRAGYYGLKKRVEAVLTKLAADLDGAIIIKSVGSGLTFNTSTGELSADSKPSVETDIDLSVFSVESIENPNVMSVTKTAKSLTFDYTSGSQIGARLAKVIEMSLIDFIKVKINVTSIYSESFPAKIGVATTEANARAGTYVTNISKGVTSGDEEIMLDVRGLNGPMYLTFDGSGDDVVFSDAKTVSQNMSTNAAKKTTRKK